MPLVGDPVCGQHHPDGCCPPPCRTPGEPVKLLPMATVWMRLRADVPARWRVMLGLALRLEFLVTHTEVGIAS